MARPSGPTITFVTGFRDFYSRDPVPGQDLAYVLEQEHGCNVERFKALYELEEELPRLKRWAGLGQLRAIILHGNDVDFDALLLLIRQQISPVLPIVVLERDDQVDPEACQDDHMFTLLRHFHLPEERRQLFGEILEGWRPPRAWLGIESYVDPSLAMRRLEAAYRGSLGDDELAAVDSNHAVVAQALRLGPLPHIVISEEYDRWLKDLAPSTRNDAQTDEFPSFDAEVARIRGMSKAERAEFRAALEAVDWCAVSGFAIHVPTYHWREGDTLTLHATPAIWLEQHISKIRILTGARLPGGIVPGMVRWLVSGFDTPILVLHGDNGPQMDQRRAEAARFILSQRKRTPVTTSGVMADEVPASTLE